MADFVAVIRRAVDGLSDNAPAMRERVYGKARAAVRRQLESMSPRPSDAVIDAQLAKLETAIGQVEADFAEPEVPLGDLVFEDLDPPPSDPGRAPVEAEAAPEQHREPDAQVPEEPQKPQPRSGPTPVPFGSYAIGRAAPYMPVRQKPEIEPPVPAGGFQPSRNQPPFDWQAPKPSEPEPEREPEAERELAPEPVPEAPQEPEQVESVVLREEAAADAASSDVAPAAAKPDAVEEVPEPEVVQASDLATEEVPEPAAAAPAEQVDSAPPAEEAEHRAEESMPAAAWGLSEEPVEPLAKNYRQADDHGDRPAETETLFPADPALERSDAAHAYERGTHTPGTGLYVARAGTPAADRKKDEPAEFQPAAHDEVFGFSEEERTIPPRAARSATLAGNGARARRSASGGRGRGIALALILLLVAGGGGTAAWLNRDAIMDLVASAPPAPVETAETPGEPEPATEPEQEVAAVDPDEAAADRAPIATPAAPADGLEKFTQRLLPNGREVDEGPAPIANQPIPSEGRSLAVQTEMAAADPGAAAEETPGTAAGEEAATPGAEDEPAAAEETLAVGQNMFLYEERLGQAGPTAIEGAVVWSTVNESPGGDQPPETAVRGEITVPEKNLSALLTIKRNADPSLPASHLVEIVFSLPENFDGGGIESIQRIAFKETEQDRGNELIAVPAKITDDFFMIALNDYAEAVTTNIDLMRSRNWIDIPVVYGNGRRALITLEKGAGGSEAFEEAMRVWQQRTSGTAAGQ